MGNLSGFVKLHRKMIEWGWYSDSIVKDVFIHILMVAAWKDGTYLGHDIKPGQAIIGRKKMAEELGFSEQQIRTALKKLESTGEISLFSTNKFTIATVENWEFYQCCDDEGNQQITNKQPTDNQQITNKQPTNNHILRNKESKEGKESKKVKNIYKDLPPELQGPLRDFIDMRKTIKSPLTDRAITMLLNKLNALSGGDAEKAVRILNQSTMNCWKSVYELREESKNPFLDELRRIEHE